MIDTTPQQDRRRTHFEILSSHHNGDWINIIILARGARARTRRYHLGLNVMENRFSRDGHHLAMQRNPRIDATTIFAEIRARLGLPPQQENNSNE